jgi:hypothetical protein
MSLTPLRLRQAAAFLDQPPPPDEPPPDWSLPKFLRDTAAEIERLRAAAKQAVTWLLLPENKDLPGSDEVFIALHEAMQASLEQDTKEGGK